MYFLDAQDGRVGELGLNQFLGLASITRLDLGRADLSIEANTSLIGMGHGHDDKQKKNFEDHCFGL